MARGNKNDPEFLDRLGAQIFEFPGVEVEHGDDRQDGTEVQSIVTGLMREAVDHYTENIEPDMVKATDYY